MKEKDEDSGFPVCAFKSYGDSVYNVQLYETDKTEINGFDYIEAPRNELYGFVVDIGHFRGYGKLHNVNMDFLKKCNPGLKIYLNYSKRKTIKHSYKRRKLHKRKL